MFLIFRRVRQHNGRGKTSKILEYSDWVLEIVLLASSSAPTALIAITAITALIAITATTAITVITVITATTAITVIVEAVLPIGHYDVKISSVSICDAGEIFIFQT